MRFAQCWNKSETVDETVDDEEEEEVKADMNEFPKWPKSPLKVDYYARETAQQQLLYHSSTVVVR